MDDWTDPTPVDDPVLYQIILEENKKLFFRPSVILCILIS